MIDGDLPLWRLVAAGLCLAVLVYCAWRDAFRVSVRIVAGASPWAVVFVLTAIAGIVAALWEYPA